MSFKEARRRAKFRKKLKRGFRGYPAATVAYYGPDDQRASKVVVAIVKAEDAEADPIRKWFSETGDVREDDDVGEEIFRFIEENAPKSVVIADGIMGCPHEEGVDYPEGEPCPRCAFWKIRDRITGELIQ
jgi:hypothetical protein